MCRIVAPRTRLPAATSLERGAACQAFGANLVEPHIWEGRGPGTIPASGTLDAISDAVASVGGAVAPSVVGVRITRPGPVASPAFGSDTRVSGAGSGVVLTGDGVVLTAAHVVARADRVLVTVAGGDSIGAEVIGLDRATDLALLRIAGGGLAAIEFAQPNCINPGQVVIAIGRPPGFGIALTAGLVSALERSVRSASGEVVENVIQTSAAIGPGTSGGALVDSSGCLVGLITSAAEDSAGAISFAIPSETVGWVTEGLLARGRVARADLGFSGETTSLPEALASSVEVDQSSGVAVRSQPSQSPSARSGIRPGDIIVRLGGEPVRRVGELQRVLSLAAGRGEIEVAAVRGGALLNFRVELAAEADLASRGA